jgi:6-phosphogluconolactonase
MCPLRLIEAERKRTRNRSGRAFLAALTLLACLYPSLARAQEAAPDAPPPAGKVGRYVYVPDENVVSVYTVNSQGKWRTNGFVPEDQNFTYWSSQIDPLGRFFFAMTNVSCNAISVFSIASPTGRLTPVAGSPFSTFSLAGAPDDAQALVVTPNGKFLYSLGNLVGSCGGNNISGLAINPTTGALTPIPGSPFSDGEQPLRGVVDSQSRFLFVADNTPDKISVFSINPTTGALTPVTGSPFSICGPSCQAAYLVLLPSDAVLYALLINPNMRIAAFTVNGATGGLAPLTGSPFPLFGSFPTGLTMHPLGRSLYASDGLSAAIWVLNIDPQTHVPRIIPGSPFTAQSHVPSVATDPKGNFLYAPSFASYYTGMYKINSSTGALTLQSNLRGPNGPVAAWFSTGAAAVTYVPKFAYVANSGSNSISEYSINTNGTLLELAGSPLPDSNGPVSVAATPSGAFVYAVDANHKVSGYSAGVSGTLTAVPGSPFSGFTAPVALATDPSNTYVFVVDQMTSPNPGRIWMEKIGSDGSLTPVNSAPNNSNTATAVAMAPGSFYFFVLNSAEKTIVAFEAGYAFNSPSITGPNGTASTGNGPSAVAVDPTSNFVYVANRTDGTVSAYKISDGNDGHNQGAPFPVAGSPYIAGTSPSAVVAEPSGKYLYVANSGSSNIFAYKIKATTGALTRIAGSFPTGSAPDSLSVSNNGKFLYASNKSSGNVSVFTINANGTLTTGTDSSAGTSPTSMASTGTTQ